MKKKVKVLKTIGEKTAELIINPFCFPHIMYQPAIPEKLQKKMKV